MKQLQNNNEIRQVLYKKFSGLAIKNSILMRDNKIVVPNSMRFQITEQVHNELGHPDTKKTVDFVSRKYTWVGMHDYIRDFCSHCDTCLKNKSSRTPKVPIVEFADPPTKPREQVAFDVATLPWASNQHRHFLLIIDMFSRYVELVPMKNQEAPTIKAALMQNWIYRHGLFNTALSDQAKNIDGETMKQLCVALNVSKKHSSPYHPEGDGMA